MAGAIASSGQAPLTTMRGSINGTIAKIDAPALSLHIQSDTGQPMRLAVANVDAMTRVSTGDHVCVEVDQGGIVLNIQQTTPAPQRPTLSYASG